MESGKNTSLPEYLLLDGGLGTEIIRQCGNRNQLYMDPLWTMRVSLSASENHVVTDVQREFLESGADVIMTNTYRSSVSWLMDKALISEEEATEAIRNAARTTCDVRDEFWSNLTDKGSRVRPLVVAAMGPYGTVLPSGTDYSGKYVDSTPIADMVEAFRSKVRAMLEGGVDILGFETIPAVKEAEAICLLMKEFPHAKAWITFCCKDGEHIGHGEKFRDAVRTTLLSETVVGVGVNCTCPKLVTSLLKEIPDDVKQKKRIVVYPNNGYIWDWTNKRWVSDSDLTPIYEYVPEWLKHGANWIGGCCHVTPKHIAQMKEKKDKYFKQ